MDGLGGVELRIFFWINSKIRIGWVDNQKNPNKVFNSTLKIRVRLVVGL